MGLHCYVNVYTRILIFHLASVAHAITCAAARLVDASEETRDICVLRGLTLSVSEMEQMGPYMFQEQQWSNSKSEIYTLYY